ncbi:hypothetical protein MMC26_005982 [Xylographa opegraphella]|nr:hypothetical protein [Xylographa opegraphella]
MSPMEALGFVCKPASFQELCCAACFAYAGTNFYNTYLNPPEDLSAWIPVMAYRIVRTITALPRGSNTTRQPLLLRIDSAEMLPGIRPKSVVVPYQDVILSEFIYTAPTKSSPAELVAAHREEDRWREIAKNNIMTLPFRQASYWMWKGFMLIKNVIWKDDFILVQVIGKNGTFKFDRNSAWALDDGRALDRLVKHRLEDD